MLDALGGPVANTDFQKLLFLYTQQCESSPSYEFVPYKLGAYSFTSDADKRRLADVGCLTNDEDQWQLTDAGRQIARKEAVMPLLVARFCRDHSMVQGNSLITEQYRKFPYYATRSEILEKILPDYESRRPIIDAQPRNSAPGLFTIGYEGRSLEGYLNLLISNSITLLCDVRRNPISRKYGFSKNTLSKTCLGISIHYEHLPELGIDSEDRRDLNTQADYDALFADYERECLPKHTEALAKIGRWMADGKRVALTCFERFPQQCHRHCVADAVAASAEKQLIPVHL